MATMRSALIGLVRRSCANSSMARRGLEMRQGIRPAAARTTPALRPAAVRNLEGCRLFSTESMKGADQTMLLLRKQKAESTLLMWWQRSRESVKNVIKGHHILVPSAISFVASFIASYAFYVSMRSIISSTTKTRTTPVRSRRNSPLPPAFMMMPDYRAMYFISLGRSRCARNEP